MLKMTKSPIAMGARLVMPVALLLAVAHAGAQDLRRGEKLYIECRACHTLEPGVNTVGPSLAGIVGRKAAADDGYRYSPAMKRSGLTWNATVLGAFIADPQGVVPGNRMPYSGMPNGQDIADLVAYIVKAGGAGSR
jgi:cytochrome c2